MIDLHALTTEILRSSREFVQRRSSAGCYNRCTVFVIDCNPSFAIFTQLALVAADHVVVPFTADDSSRRAVENVVTLLYGFTEAADVASYTKISFAKKAKEEGVPVPCLHTFVSNRVTKYEGKPSKAFNAMIKAMKMTIDKIHQKHKEVFDAHTLKPSTNFLFVPDYHSATVADITIRDNECRDLGQPYRGSVGNANYPNLPTAKRGGG